MAQRARKKRSRVAPAPAATSVTARALVPYIVGVAGAFVALVALDRLVLRTAVLTPFEGLPPLSPLYAFWMPAWRPTASLFVLVALALVAFAPRLLDVRLSERRFGAILLVLALLAPLALFLVRESPDRLGSQFLIYRGEEYFDDAQRITDFPGFIRHYTEIAPYLSLHGRVHPPGFASFLFLTGRLAG